MAKRRHEAQAGPARRLNLDAGDERGKDIVIESDRTVAI
jgi:hypothetical protein